MDVDEVIIAVANVVGLCAAYFADDLINDDDDTVWEKVTVVVDDYVRMGDPSLRMHFRLNRHQCEILYQELSLHIEEQGIVVELPSPHGRPFSHQLLMVLWILATPDSFRSVALRFGVYKSEVHNYYVKIITALREIGPRFIKWPTRDERYEIKTYLEGYSDFAGIIGMMDGKHFTISKPANDPAAFRDHQYSLSVQTVCDHNMLVRDLYIGEAGSLHDGRVFRRSPLFRSIIFDDDLMGRDEHIVADSAYMLLDKVLVPFDQDGHLHPVQKNFNYLLSKCRVTIERTFGKLCMMWRRDYFLHSHNMDYTIDHIVATFVLHNFMIVHGKQYHLEQVHDEEIEDILEQVNVGPGMDDHDLDGYEPDAHDAILNHDNPLQYDGAARLQRARRPGDQKRWDICNALPLAPPRDG